MKWLVGFEWLTRLSVQLPFFNSILANIEIKIQSQLPLMSCLETHSLECGKKEKDKYWGIRGRNFFFYICIISLHVLLAPFSLFESRASKSEDCSKFHVLQKRQLVNFEALKLWNVRSGPSSVSVDVPWGKFYFMSWTVSKYLEQTHALTDWSSIELRQNEYTWPTLLEFESHKICRSSFSKYIKLGKTRIMGLWYFRYLQKIPHVLSDRHFSHF